MRDPAVVARRNPITHEGEDEAEIVRRVPGKKHFHVNEGQFAAPTNLRDLDFTKLAKASGTGSASAFARNATVTRALSPPHKVNGMSKFLDY